MMAVGLMLFFLLLFCGRKEDYDLCSICFAAMGNEADYIKMDRTMSCRNPWSSKCFNDPVWLLFICADV
jgi:next-to-BRCA1 protein 1